jgi:alpha-tubulin suppressor-like RCC1 family protein
MSDGSLWTWGSNDRGQLGDGTTINRKLPVKILDDVISIAAGKEHSLAIKYDGSLWTWGSNDRGQLGDGTTTDHNLPVKILDDVISIVAGEGHSLAIKSDGSLWVWGSNNFCQLGDKGSIDRTLPVKVLDDVFAMAAGYTHSLAIKSDGSLLAWGDNNCGQLGDGTTSYHTSPVKIFNDVLFIAEEQFGDYRFFLTIKNDGSLWAWGDNNCGQLGDGTTIDRAMPVKILNDVASATAKNFSSFAIKSDGSLWAWGENDFCQLGNGTTQNQTTPVNILNDVASIVTGEYSSYAIKNNGSLWAWGYNSSGQIGNGTTTNCKSPVKILNDVVSVSAGGSYSLAIKSDGSLWAWGNNKYGQLGDKTTTNCKSPVKILDDVVSVSAGYRHSLAIKSDGSLWAWGENGRGQLGNGTTNRSTIPIKILDDVISIAAGRLHSLAIKSDGSLWAWGDNDRGQLGNGTTNGSTIPIKILDDVISVTANDFSSFVIKSDGSLWILESGQTKLLNSFISSTSSLGIKSDNTLWIWEANVVDTLIHRVEIPIRPLLLNFSVVNKVSVIQGEYKIICPILEPINADYDTITWLSSDESIATVSPRGIVTGVSVGETTLTARATSKEGTVFERTCTVVVEEVPPVMVTANDIVVEYGEQIPSLEYDIDGDIIGLPELCCAATSSSPVGKYPIEVKRGSIDGNNVVFLNGTLTITPAPLTIAAKYYEVRQGDAYPQFEASYMGFKNDETTDVLTKQPVFSCEATPNSKVDSYILYVSGAEAENYEICYEPGLLTILNNTGSKFTASISVNGMNEIATFRITDINNRLVSVGDGESVSVDDWTEGDIAIPSNVIGLDGVTYQVTGISDGAFQGCYHLTSIILPQDITTIGEAAFADCYGLTTIEIPTSVTRICSDAFYSSGLTTLVIPRNVTSIGIGAFQYCNDLTSLTVEWDEPLSIDEDCFSNAANATLQVPFGTKNKYEVATGWKEFKYIVEMAPKDGDVFTALTAEGMKMTFTVTSASEKTCKVGDGSNSSVSAITEGGITIPTIANGYAVTQISYMAFYNCKQITAIEIPTCISSIGTDAFDGCYNLTSVTVGWDEPIAISTNCFSNAANATLYVPVGMNNDYKAATGWKNFGQIVNGMENVLDINDAMGRRGGKVVLPILMNNEEDIISVSFKLVLPSGFSITECSLSDRKGDHIVYSEPQSDGSYLITAFSINNQQFKGIEGPVMNLTINIDGNVEPGTYSATIKEIELSTANNPIYPIMCKQTILVDDFLTGDADGSGEVTPFDAVLAIRYYLGRNLSRFWPKAANVNGDKKDNGEENITPFDAVSIIKIYLKNNKEKNSSRRRITTFKEENNPQ